MILREQKMMERSELAANLARRDYYPDYTVSGGYFNQGSMPPMWQFRVDVKLPAILAQAARRGHRAGIHRQRGAPHLRGRRPSIWKRASARTTRWRRRRAS